jgi:hypothetical protein
MSKYTARSYDQCAVGAQDKTLAVSNTLGAAGAAASVTITHDGSTFIYITGFEITSSLPTAAGTADVTVTGLTGQDSGGTLRYKFAESTSVQPQLIVEFANPIPTNDVNTDLVLSVGAVASGGIVAIVVHGYRRPE